MQTGPRRRHSRYPQRKFNLGCSLRMVRRHDPLCTAELGHCSYRRDDRNFARQCALAQVLGLPRLMHWRRHGRVVVLFSLLLGFFWLLLGRTYPYRDLDLDRPASASRERLRGTPRSAAVLPAARVNALRASYLQLLKQDNACISLAQTQQPNAQTEWQLHDLEVQNQSADLDTWNELHGDEPPVQTIWQRVDIKELKHAVANLPTNAWTRIGRNEPTQSFSDAPCT